MNVKNKINKLRGESQIEMYSKCKVHTGFRRLRMKRKSVTDLINNFYIDYMSK